jgi:hypothetical protein
MARSKATNSDMSMKVILVVALALAFIGGYLVARARYKPQILELNKMVLEKDTSLSKIKANANKVMMKDDAMWVVEEGIVSQMEEEVTLSNGATVGVDGKVTNADGTEMMLKNGESISMDGEMIPDEVDDTESVEF